MAEVYHEFPAWLWNGQQQIAGRILFQDEKICFDFSQFDQSHLKLEIYYDEIISAEEFLVFDLARNAIRIQTRNGNSSLFVVEDLASFKKVLGRYLRN